MMLTGYEPMMLTNYASNSNTSQQASYSSTSYIARQMLARHKLAES